MTARRLPRPGDLAELVRAPAALTVPGDALAGAALAGWPYGPRTPLAAAASVSLYWAGMALNDYADREVDAAERPGRPIPSGRVAPGLALGLAAGLTAAGVGLAWLAGGRRAVAVAAPLAAAVWAYDLGAKDTPAGPAVMATCRALDVCLGAGAGRARRAVPAAAAVGAHTLLVTALSRGEVRGAPPALPWATLAATAGVAGASAAAALRPGRPGAARRLAALGALAAYATGFGRAQLAAARDPAAGRVRAAVGAGILGMLPLQAAWVAVGGRLAAALPLAAAVPLARRLFGRVSPT